jgi:DNA-binding GntR family transcriptional regulator
MVSQADGNARGNQERRGDASARAMMGLRDALMQGVLRPGDPVIEDEWAERLQVSRTPVRAAMSVLATEGVLVKRRRQVYVFQPSLDDLIEVYEIRSALERMAASAAADTIQRDGLAQLEEELQEMNRTEGTAAWFTAHERFHMGIFEGSGKNRLVDMIGMLRRQSEPYVRYAVHADPKFRVRAMRDHRQMIATLKRRDGVMMDTLVERHLNATVQVLRQLLAIAPNADFAPFPPTATSVPVAVSNGDASESNLASSTRLAEHRSPRKFGVRVLPVQPENPDDQAGTRDDDCRRWPRERRG